MVDAYGAKWTSNHGDCDEGDTWLIFLQGVTPEQLGVGFMACGRAHPEWPPTLWQFRALCEAKARAPYVETPPTPPRTQAEIDAGLAHLKNIRKILKHAAREERREDQHRRRERVRGGRPREPGDDDA